MEEMSKPRHKKHGWNLVEIVVGLGLIVASILILYVAIIPTPDIATFTQRKILQSTKIYDRTGDVLLYDLNRDFQRRVIPLAEISPYLKNATVAIEDAEFYQHYGVRPLAVVRAMIINILTGEFSQGGSTITQQVVKNSVLTTDKTIDRKLKEWVLAVKLEQKYSKDQILEWYLNENPYGGTLYGVEEASQAFFRKSAHDVTLAEAAYLAALPQAPSYYSPQGEHRDALEARKNTVLSRMRELGFITQEEYDGAKDESVAFYKVLDGSLKAPHFVFYVQHYLEQKYGARALAENGLTVTTTLDYTLQEKAELIVNQYALQNEKDFNAENAGLVAIDPTNGHILTMVGSRGYFDTDIDGNVNVTTAYRQPGSTFKPFVYAAALEKGYTRNTILYDVPTQFVPTCDPFNFTNNTPCYAPDNYDLLYRGPMTMMQALAQSINVPAVKTLYLVGIDNAIQMARRLGVTTLTNSGRYGLTLVLGGGEVTLLQMTSAYGVFANKGVRHDPVFILEVKDAQGNVLEKYNDTSGSQVLDPGVAADISFMLSNNEARTPAYGANSPLYFPGRDVAAKTGTTNDSRDAWIIGFTPNIVVGAWAGNNDNSPMVKQVAGYIVAPLWNTFMKEAIVLRPKEYFREPTMIDESLPPRLQGIADGHSLLFGTDKNNPRGPAPINPASDPQFRNWEAAVLSWLGS
jgi:1A family penicillin-binding protein